MCAGLIRDGVAPEFVDTVEICVDCGRPTAHGESLSRRDGAAADRVRASEALEFNDLATVFIASGTMQGEIVASLLDAAGIPVHVKGAPLQGAMGELPADVVQVELQVPRERVEEALELTARWESPNADQAEAVVEVESEGASSASEAREISSAVRRALKTVEGQD